MDTSRRNLLMGLGASAAGTIAVTLTTSAGRTLAQTAAVIPTSLRANPQFTGVNVQGMENGDRGGNHTNDVAGTHYVVPSQADMNYLSARGATVVRLPFMFERMVPVLGGALKASYLADVVTVLDRAAAATPTPVKVLLDCHSYAEYHGSSGIIRLGTSGYTIADHADMWQRIAAAVKDHTGLFGYDILNEPQGIASSVVADMYQQCVNALAAIDPNHWVFVEGNRYAGSHEWTGQNPNYPLADPADRIIYSAHMYSDPGHGGNTTTYPTWASCVANGSTDQTGVRNLSNFLDWLEATGKRGNIGEHGFYADGLQAGYNTIVEARSRGASFFAWHFGPGFGSDAFATYPYDGTEQPHWSVLGDFTGYVASTYKLTGVRGAKPGVASTPLTVAYTGCPAQVVRITPSDGGKGGTFSPAIVTLAAGTFAPSASFTYTNPAAIAGITIEVANDSGLTDPSSLAFSTDAANPVNLEPDPNIAWSTDNGAVHVGYDGEFARLSDNGENSQHFFTSMFRSVVPNVPVKASVVLKDESRGFARFHIFADDKPSESAYVDVNLSAGTLGTPVAERGASNVAAEISLNGTERTVRLTVTMPWAKRLRTRISLISGMNTVIYTGNGSALLAKTAKFYQPV